MFKKSLIIIALPLLLLATEWQSLNGPPAGRADDMSIGYDPTIPGWAIYAADRTHKLYKSVNEGEYWDSIPTAIPNPNIINPICVITDESNAQIVYIGRNYATPVWKSSDGGGIWEPKSTGITNPNPLCFAMDPGDEDILFLGCEKYPWIYRTLNGGGEWEQKPMIPQEPYGRVEKIAVVRDEYSNIIILTAYRSGSSNSIGVYRSTNNGETWQHTLQQHQVNSVAFFDDQIAYAGCWNEDCSIYKSYDGGINWEPLPLSPYHESVFDFVVVDADLIYAATSMGIYMSTNGGNSWVLQNNGIIAKCAMTLMNHPANNQVLFAGTEFSLYKTENSGSQWIEKTRGFKPLKTTGLALSSQYFWTIGRPFGPMNSALHPMQVSFSENNGDSWSATFWTPRWQTVTGWSIEACADNGQLAFVSYLAWLCDDPPPRQVSSVICRSSDLGTTWERAYTTGPNIQFPVAIHQIVSNPLIRGYVYAAFDYVPTPGDQAGFMRSNQYGVSGSWSPAIQGLGVDTVYSISINPHDGNNLYTGTASHGVYESVDNADNWTQTGLNDVDVNALAIDFDYPDTIYAGSENPYGIYKTTNGFETYPSQANNGLDYLYIADLEIDPSEPTIVYTLCKENESAEETHVYCTVDRAGKWFDVTAGLPTDKPTHDLEIDRDEPDPVYAATEQGVYTYTPDFNKSLVSSSDKASSYNNGRKMVRNGNDIWITYESGGVVYVVHSDDNGQSWSKKREMGKGYNPCMGIKLIQSQSWPTLGVVWWAQGTRDTLYFSKYSSGSWGAPTAIVTSNNDFSPPSFVLHYSDYGHMVYVEGGSYIKYTKFDINGESEPQTYDVDTGDNENPSIGYMSSLGNPEIHIVYKSGGRLYYKSRTGSTWNDREFIILGGTHPCLEVVGTVVHIVCHVANNIRHYYTVYTGGPRDWNEEQVNNSNDYSDYPVITSGSACAWVENVGGTNKEIYFSIRLEYGWTGPMNISNTASSCSDYPHIVHKQTAFQTTIYFAWTERNSAPFDVKFTSQVLGGGERGEDPDLMFYYADAGENVASPFNRRRESYTQYGPEFFKKIDYDSEYLEYQFEGLSSENEYALTVYAYQQDFSNLNITVKADNAELAKITIPEDTLIMCKKMLPIEVYADSMVNVKIFGEKALCAALVLHEYEEESKGGGPQSSETMLTQFGQLTLSTYPNPTKKAVRIEYNLPAKMGVKLSIYDVTGRLVKNIVNENQDAGFYHESFDITDLSQGVYFVKLNTGDKSIIEKVIFLR